MTGRSRRAPALVLALLFVLGPLCMVAGCKQAEVQPAGEPPTSNIDELQRRIAHQELVIDNQLAARRKPADELQQQSQPATGAGEADQTVQSAAPTPPEAAPAPPEAAAAPEEAPAQQSEATVEKSAAVGASAGSTCDLVCRALASMRRSADRICELVGEKDPRCTQAQKQVDDAARRVRGASCTCSG